MLFVSPSLWATSECNELSLGRPIQNAEMVLFHFSGQLLDLDLSYIRFPGMLLKFPLTLLKCLIKLQKCLIVTKVRCQVTKVPCFVTKVPFSSGYESALSRY